MTREQQLFAAARLYFELLRPVTATPKGAEGSPERLVHEAQMAAHAELANALAAYEFPQAGAAE